MARKLKKPLIPKSVIIAGTIALIILIGLNLLNAKNNSASNNLISSNSNLDIAVCDPANGPFSLEINNPYFPLTVGDVKTYENEKEKVVITVLDETEEVAGITTRVVEEREWENDMLKEVSRNYFVQALEGTVCYFGEDVDDYNRDGAITGHGGAWRAGEGINKPGIMMPTDAKAGQKYFQEVAPGVAEDYAEHLTVIKEYPTPEWIYDDVLIVQETPKSDKRYAKGIGMIYDDGLIMVEE